jgi:hypothetical protein
MRNTYTNLIGNPEGKMPVGRLFVDGRIMLKLNVGKQGVRMWTELIWLRLRSNERLL